MMPLVKAPRHQEFLALIRSRLSEQKVTHCVFVAEYISSFAAKIEVDHDAAVTVGLLHDICRKYTDEELITAAINYGITITDTFKAKPALLHGPIAAEEVRENLGIVGEDIYEAIYWHTFGCPGLGRLGQALYVADFAEPKRQYPEAAVARDLLRKEGFDVTLKYVVEQKTKYVKKKADIIDPTTMAFYEWIEKEFGHE